MAEIRYGSVEPSKKLYAKIGTGASYSLDEVIAELIDNSIEARTPSQLRRIDPEQFKVEITINRDFIEVVDNGKGMDGKEAVGALKLGESTDPSRKLSGFGLGLKTGCLSVGDTFGIMTGVEGKEEMNKVYFNIQKWENDPNLGFTKPYPYEVISKSVNKHGTKIVITDLRTNITSKKIENMMTEIANRYRGYMKNKEIVITINSKEPKPDTIEWRKGYPINVDIPTKHGHITGIIGITEHMTYTKGGSWGVDLFRNNRLICQKQKFGRLLEHPTFALFRGELNFDFVPVAQTKNRFIEESKEWEDAVKAISEDNTFMEIAKKVKDLRWNPVSQISKKIEKKINAKMEVLARVLDRKYREEFKPNAIAPVGAKKIVEVEVEQRESPTNHTGSVEPGDGTRKRTPKRYHKRLKFKQSNGKVFEVDYDFNFVEGGCRKTLVDEKHRVVVYTNMAFPSYKQTTDEVFYVMENVIDAITERRAIDNNFSTEKFFEEREELLSQLYTAKERKED